MNNFDPNNPYGPGQMPQQGYPQQGQQQFQQTQQQPQQFQGQQQQFQGQQQFQQQPPQQMQQQFAQPQQPPAALPQFHLPDESLVQAAFEQVRTEVAQFGGGDGPVYYKFKGPQGETKWDSVFVGYQAFEIFYLLPGWAPGKNFFKKVRSHFVKTPAKPNGTSIGCSGVETCLFCQSRNAALDSPNPQLASYAKSMGKARTQFLYQGAVLANPNGHYDKNGVMRPIILPAGIGLHNAIGNLISARGGAAVLINPSSGRPVRVMKKKTGQRNMDVEYDALDENPQPLPQQFWPLLDNLWDLDKEDKIPSNDEMVKLLNQIGLPVVGQTAATYAMMPNAPYPNPYQQQEAQPQAPMNAPGYGGQGVVQNTAQNTPNSYTPAATGFSTPPVPTGPTAPTVPTTPAQAPVAPAPVQPQQVPQQVPPIQPQPQQQQMMPSNDMAVPPPVTSNPEANTNYSMQLGTAPAAVEPVQQQVPPQAPQVPQQPVQQPAQQPPVQQQAPAAPQQPQEEAGKPTLEQLQAQIIGQ